MIRFELAPSFKRAYKKRIAGNKKLEKRVRERMKLFQNNPHHPLLHDHSLKGKKVGLRSFSIAGDMRILYFMEDNLAYFIDIGTHNQVY